MPISHYFYLLETERQKRFQKLLHYSKFLDLQTSEEKIKISEEFYQNFPTDEVFKPLNELLNEMSERQITPNSAFVEALDEYFRIRIKSAALE
jgi:hypothetical protein